MQRGKLGPSGWWYAVSGVLGIVSIMIFVVTFCAIFLKIKHGIRRFAVPGVHVLPLPAKGAYTIYHEYRSVIDGAAVSRDEGAIDDVKVSVRDATSGTTVEVAGVSRNTRYDFGETRKGVGVFEFEVEHGGNYVFEAGYPEGRENPLLVLAVGPAIGAQILIPTVLLTLAMSACALCSAVILGGTLYKRYKAKHIQAQSSP